MIESDELHRVRCLQAMGIAVYVARRPLPGARPLPRLAVQRGAPSPSSLGAQLRAEATPGASRETAAATASTRAAGKPSAPRQPELPALRFSIAAVVAAGRLWVEELDGVPLAREQVQLMEAIGRALDYPRREAGQARAAQFDWPLLDNPQLDLGAAEAAAALHGFLARQLTEHACTAVMCCGEAARARLGEAAFAVPVDVLPATRELLAAPLEKRALWQRLRR